jgi:hypothetical protein
MTTWLKMPREISPRGGMDQNLRLLHTAKNREGTTEIYEKAGFRA